MTLIRLDECISWRIGEAINALGLPRGVTIESPQRLGQNGQPDVNWIEDFAGRGGRLVVSGDASMRSVQLERAALEASGLIAVFPSSKQFFDGLGRWGQAAYLMAWWPAILKLAEEGDAGTHWRLPPTFSGDFASLIPMKPLAEIDEERKAKAEARLAERAARLVGQEPENQ